MTAPLTRRRFLALSGAVLAAGPAAARQPAAVWHGRALGSAASLRIAGLSQAEAVPVFAAAEAELARLEEIFSLYLPGSELAQLNRTGQLAAPAPELLDVLSLSSSLHQATEGRFDPSVQPLWRAHALGQDTDTAARAVGWGHVQFSAQEIRFSRPGMALTLNGIAQGYITGRIAALLRAGGLKNVLVGTGETMALGQRPGGGGWHAGVAAPDGGLRTRLTLSGRALATSAAAGTRFDSGLSHILDPKSGSGAGPGRLVSVSAADPALADGLSTALCLLPPAAARAAVARFPEARLEYLA